MIKSNEQLLAEATVTIQEQAKRISYYESNDSKSQIETQRYKQDCRKRALEMAHHELLSDKIMYNKDGEYEEGVVGNAEGKGWKPAKHNLITLADKYYNWLISIPNDK